MQPVILVCGVSGSGKSWASRQMAGTFHYIPHDRCWVMPGKRGWDASQVWEAGSGDASRYEPGAESNHADVLIAATQIAEKPVLTECPHGERLLRERLEQAGVKVIPVFVIEPPDLVARRYLAREGKSLPKNVWTRARTIVDRAREWNAFMGTSDEVLSHLKDRARAMGMQVA